MATGLPSNALYDVQRYLRQKRATGAQVTPQEERAAWSGYYDTLAANSLNERQFGLQQQRLDILKDQQKAEADAAKVSGVGQLVSAGGSLGMLLKDTEIGKTVGSKVSGLFGGSPPTTTPSTGAATAGATGAAPTTATVGAGVPTTTADLTAITGGDTAVAAGAETGILSSISPYLGPAGAGFMAGRMVPGFLGMNKGAGELAAGAVSGAAAGAAIGSVVPGPGTAVGAVIGAVAGGVGSKIK